MAWERLDISVLVVDDDDTSLTIVANILSSWEYKGISLSVYSTLADIWINMFALEFYRFGPYMNQD